jgi:calcineurin-like phosphoesterase family protein
MDYLTSDTHFRHSNIIQYCNRPFSSTGEMDETMIKNWNSVVGVKDTVRHLGDVAFGRGATAQEVGNILKRLNGTIHLIKGNHEKLALANKWRFASIKDYDEIEIEGQRIVLFHYGLRTWHHDLRGVWHLYGHSHGGLPPMGKSLDIGVDCWNFTPVSFQELKKKMDTMPIHKAPKFENFVIGGEDNGSETDTNITSDRTNEV